MLAANHWQRQDLYRAQLTYSSAHTRQFMQSAAQLLRNMIDDFETTLTLTFKARA